MIKSVVGGDSVELERKPPQVASLIAGCKRTPAFADVEIESLRRINLQRPSDPAPGDVYRMDVYREFPIPPNVSFR